MRFLLNVPVSELIKIVFAVGHAGRSDSDFEVQ